jgi:hypothetical protein
VLLLKLLFGRQRACAHLLCRRRKRMGIGYLTDLLTVTENPYKRAVLYLALFAFFISTCYTATAFAYRNFTTEEYRRKTHSRLVVFLNNVKRTSTSRLFFRTISRILVVLNIVYGPPHGSALKIRSYLTVRAFQASAIITCLYLSLSEGFYPGFPG